MVATGREVVPAVVRAVDARPGIAGGRVNKGHTVRGMSQRSHVRERTSGEQHLWRFSRGRLLGHRDHRDGVVEAAACQHPGSRTKGALQMVRVPTVRFGASSWTTAISYATDFWDAATAKALPPTARRAMIELTTQGWTTQRFQIAFAFLSVVHGSTPTWRQVCHPHPMRERHAIAIIKRDSGVGRQPPGRSTQSVRTTPFGTRCGWFQTTWISPPRSRCLRDRTLTSR